MCWTAGPNGALHGVGGLVPAQCTSEIILDFLLSVAAVLIAELHADAGGALALRPLGGHPDDPPRHGELLLLPHQIQQHEHFVAQAIIAVRRNEQAAVLHERHIGEIQRAFILDRKRQQTWFVTWTTQFLPFPKAFRLPARFDYRAAMPQAPVVDSCPSMQDAATHGRRPAARIGLSSWP